MKLCHVIRTATAVAALSVPTLVPTALAHHAAGPANAGTSGPVNTISAGTMRKGDVVVGVTVDRTAFDALSDAVLASAAEDAANGGDLEAHFHSIDTITTTALTAAYGITDDLMITARLPYVVREGVREGHAHDLGEGGFEGEVHVPGDSKGWGDLSILGQWRFMKDEEAGTQMALLFGVKAPTGKTDLISDEAEAFDAEFQPGSDSWDYYLGLAASQAAGRWGFDASGLYTFAGEGLGADLGDRFNYAVSASYRVLGSPAHDDAGEAPHSHGAAVDLVFELTGEWHGKQKEDGATDPDSGGHVLYAAPGVRYTLDRFAAFASVGVPLITDFNGLQAEPGDVRATIGAGYRL